jgi:D-alanyl-D-alanine carboxypeptidase
VSYPDGKEAITGYAPEPWHVRFVGVDEAAKVHASGLTLHEYLLKP